jgi:hypothetical protein
MELEKNFCFSEYIVINIMCSSQLFIFYELKHEP